MGTRTRWDKRIARVDIGVALLDPKHRARAKRALTTQGPEQTPRWERWATFFLVALGVALAGCILLHAIDMATHGSHRVSVGQLIT